MSRESPPYRIVDDESGHEYVIPVFRTAEWEKWIYSEDWEDGDVPGWAEQIDGHFIILDYRLS